MTNLLNSENNFYYGSGDKISCFIDMNPKHKIITLGYDNGSQAYAKSYRFEDRKKADWFCNRVVKGIKSADKKNSVQNFNFFDSISKERYQLEEVERTQELRELLHS